MTVRRNKTPTTAAGLCRPQRRLGPPKWFCHWWQVLNFPMDGETFVTDLDDDRCDLGLF